MDIESFKEKYSHLRDVDKVDVDGLCGHPKHKNTGKQIGKGPAKRNILKHGGAEFICRDCLMKYDNPMNHVGECRQTEDAITVFCPCPEHQGDPAREMKKACYYGEMKEPYLQMCGSCAQRGKEISEEQREKIRKTLTGRKLSPEHVKNILAYRENNPEWAEKANRNLIPGMGGIARKGKPLPEDWKKAISDGNKDKPKSEKHRENISTGRKRMLDEQGGFTRKHRENISKATIKQYQAGFEPRLHHLRGWHESPKAGKVYYRSSYEKKAYLKLDQDETVALYETEFAIVEYFHPKKEITSSYMIDIFVEYTDGTAKLVEVKPEKWLQDEVVKAKLAAGEKLAEDLEMPFEVWTEMDLFGHVYNKKNMQLFIEKVKNGEV